MTDFADNLDAIMDRAVRVLRTPRHDETVTVKTADLVAMVRTLHAARLLINTIETTGGVRSSGGMHVCVADEDWYDLAEAYIEACSAVDREPKVAQQGGHR